MSPAGGATIAVLGAGSFGTVIAGTIAARGHRVQLWMRNPEQAASIATQRENSRYLPGYRLPDSIFPMTDLQQAVAGVEAVFFCIPSTSFAEIAANVAAHLQADTLLISTTKGVIRNGFRLMSDILAEHCPHAPRGVLSGPNLAKEIAAGNFTGTVIASKDATLRQRVQELVHSRSFRVYSNPDMFGVELGGALKNIYAIATGMAVALGAGQNSIAMLLTRGLGEMSRLATTMGANPVTFLGLAGVGDLMATCNSPLSRNYQLGLAVGQGRKVQQTQEDMEQVAEGLNTIVATWEQAQQLGVPMPIVQGLHEILFDGKPLAEVLIRLMLAEQRDDVMFSAGAGDTDTA